MPCKLVVAICCKLIVSAESCSLMITYHNWDYRCGPLGILDRFNSPWIFESLQILFSFLPETIWRRSCFVENGTSSMVNMNFGFYPFYKVLRSSSKRWLSFWTIPSKRLSSDLSSLILGQFCLIIPNVPTQKLSVPDSTETFLRWCTNCNININ